VIDHPKTNQFQDFYEFLTFCNSFSYGMKTDEYLIC